RVEAGARTFFLGDEHAGSVRCRRRALPLRQARRICSGRGRHRDPACPRVLARSMIAAKYRLFSAEPKASKFPRYAHTEEVAVWYFDLGRHAISPGWSATESYPASTARLVLRSRLVGSDRDCSRLTGSYSGQKSGSKKLKKGRSQGIRNSGGRAKKPRSTG